MSRSFPGQAVASDRPSPTRITADVADPAEVDRVEAEVEANQISMCGRQCHHEYVSGLV